MTNTEKYYDLTFEIEINNSQISFLEKHPEYKDELVIEYDRKSNLEQQLKILKHELSKKNQAADNTRIALIQVINSVLEKLTIIKKWPNYYPDLNQGMIIPGYLFGKILDNLKYAVKSEGNYYPTTHIYMSEVEWDYFTFEKNLASLRQELIQSIFLAQIEAIEFYEKIKNVFIENIDNLRDNGVI